LQSACGVSRKKKENERGKRNFALDPLLGKTPPQKKREKKKKKTRSVFPVKGGNLGSGKEDDDGSKNKERQRRKRETGGRRGKGRSIWNIKRGGVQRHRTTKEATKGQEGSRNLSGGAFVEGFGLNKWKEIGVQIGGGGPPQHSQKSGKYVLVRRWYSNSPRGGRVSSKEKGPCQGR